MALHDLSALRNDFVVHYGVSDQKINAVTFAESLTALHSALQIVNRRLNPDYDLEISISAIGPGSFRSLVVSRAKQLGPLVGKPFNQVVVGVLVAVISARCVGSEPKTVINIDTVIIQSGASDQRVVIPKEIRPRPNVGRSEHHGSSGGV